MGMTHKSGRYKCKNLLTYIIYVLPGYKIESRKILLLF